MAHEQVNRAFYTVFVSTASPFALTHGHVDFPNNKFTSNTFTSLNGSKNPCWHRTLYACSRARRPDLEISDLSQATTQSRTIAPHGFCTFHLVRRCASDIKRFCHAFCYFAHFSYPLLHLHSALKSHLMFNTGFATGVLVVSEFVLTLLVAITVHYVTKLRVRRQLYVKRYVDLSQLTWVARHTIHPQLLRYDPYLLLLNVFRLIGPFMLLILFVLISNTIQTSLDFGKVKSVRSTVHSYKSHWDTMGRKPLEAMPLIDKALAKGQWKGLPATDFVPVHLDEFSRLDWKAREEYVPNYECSNVLEEEGQYSLSFLLGPSIYNMSFLKTDGMVPMYSRMRRVQNNQVTELLGPTWIVTPFRGNTGSGRDSYVTSFAEAEMLARSIDGKKGANDQYVSGAAWTLAFKGMEDVLLDDQRYLNVLNGFMYGFPENYFKDLCAKSNSIGPGCEASMKAMALEDCEAFTKQNVTIEFLGMKSGRRSLFEITHPTTAFYDRVDVVRARGLRQKFTCRRRNAKGLKCSMLPLSGTSFAAAIAAMKNASSLYGLTRDAPSLIDGQESKLSEKLTTDDVQEALDLGIHVLTAGASAAERQETVRLAMMKTSFDWTFYTAVVATTVAICALLVGWEIWAYIRLGKLRRTICPPLDPLQMAMACGVPGMEGLRGARKVKTPLRPLGVGAQLRGIDFDEDAKSDKYDIQVGVCDNQNLSHIEDFRMGQAVSRSLDSNEDA